MNGTVPKLTYRYLFHAFITHCPEDLLFAKHLVAELEKIGFKCIIAERDFLVGAPIIDNIADAINNSRRVVMIISEASLKSEWCRYEMLATLSDSHERNNVTLLPVIMADVDDQQLPQPIRFLTYIHLGREKEYFPKLVDCLRADCESWESLLPAGNVAHGLAWSYYFGYLKVLLPGIDNRIERSEWWGSRQESRRMSRKLYLLFPVSCMCKDTLCDDDDAITHAGHLETIVRNRAGTVGRSYQSTVYKITDQDMKEWFFVGEYVTAIHTMYEMEMNSHFSGLQTDDKYLQATRFLITIRNILEKDPHCRGRYKFLPYTDVQSDGTKLKISQLLLQSIQKEIKRELKEEYPNDHSDFHDEASTMSIALKKADSREFSRSLLKLFDLNSLSSTTLEMQKDEPVIEKDRRGKTKSLVRGNNVTNFFAEDSPKIT